MGFSRAILLVLDGLGVGGAPDVELFGDTGSDTLGNLARTVALDIPVLASLGLGNLYEKQLPNIPHAQNAKAIHGRLTEVSGGKDTTTGHWEMMGIVRQQMPRTFPDGFPHWLIEEFVSRTGRGVLGNKAASGTEIIKELGAQHLQSGDFIVYTSADSVFQVAAHIDVISLEELYAACMTARGLLIGDIAVDRVIARPFAGDAVIGFYRTEDRKDFSLMPPGPTVLDQLASSGLEVIGVGKISDIFAAQGITQSFPDHGNDRLMGRVESLVKAKDWKGLTFCNLVDFDMLYGHRNNPEGFAAALKDLDSWLGDFLGMLNDGDLCIITADHGNDPTTTSTDHSREQVPALITSLELSRGAGRIVTPEPGFYHIGKTICHALGVNCRSAGTNLMS